MIKRTLIMVLVVGLCFVSMVNADSRADDCRMGHEYNGSDVNQYGFDDYSGMEYSDQYYVLLDPTQCGACSEGVCVDNFNFATEVSFDNTSYSFNVILCGAVDTGGSCYAPDLSDIRATAGPYLFENQNAGSYLVTVGGFSAPQWCIDPMEPVFIGFEWVLKPSAWEMDFLCNSDGCNNCNLYYEDPSVPNSMIDFCNSGNWSNTGSPYIWSEMSCTGTPADVPSMNIFGLILLLGVAGYLISKR